MSKIKSFKIYTDDEDKALVGNSLETALEILENNGYIVEVEYENELHIVPCKNNVGEWEISPIHETFDTRKEAEKRLRELKDDKRKTWR